MEAQSRTDCRCLIRTGIVTGASIWLRTKLRPVSKFSASSAQMSTELWGPWMLRGASGPTLSVWIGSRRFGTRMTQRAKWVGSLRSGALSWTATAATRSKAQSYSATTGIVGAVTMWDARSGTIRSRTGTRCSRRQETCKTKCFSQSFAIIIMRRAPRCLGSSVKVASCASKRGSRSAMPSRDRSPSSPRRWNSLSRRPLNPSRQTSQLRQWKRWRRKWSKK